MTSSVSVIFGQPDNAAAGRECGPWVYTGDRRMLQRLTSNMTGRVSSVCRNCIALVGENCQMIILAIDPHERAPRTGSQPSPTRSLGDQCHLYGTASAARGDRL